MRAKSSFFRLIRLSPYEHRHFGISLLCVILASSKRAFRISVLYIRQPSRFARKKFAPSASANEISATVEIRVAERCVHQSRTQKIHAVEVGSVQEHPTQIDVGPLPTA